MLLPGDLMLSFGRAGEKETTQTIGLSLQRKSCVFCLQWSNIHSLLPAQASVWFKNCYRFSVFTYSSLIPLLKKQGNYFLASDSSPNTFVKMAISGATISGDNAKEHNCLKYLGIFHTLHFASWSAAFQLSDWRAFDHLPVIKTSASVCFNFIC